MDHAVLLAIESLRRASLTGLRQQYREVFQEEARSRHREHLFRRIAWRLQALAEGDLSERARRRAHEIANDADLRINAPRDFFTVAGERVGTVPFGSRLAADGAQLEADASEQAILTRMGALRSEGLTMRCIAERLNQDGLRTRRGTAWRFQYVAQALRSVGGAPRLSVAA